MREDKGRKRRMAGGGMQKVKEGKVFLQTLGFSKGERKERERERGIGDERGRKTEERK